MGFPRMSVCARTHTSDEGGFTIVEMVVAVSILAISLLSLAYTASIGFTYSARARQKQDAASLANQAAEQVKALAFANLEDGMMTSDLTGDPAITTCGAVKCFDGETIVESTSPPTSPLNPHVATFTVGPTTFTRKAYLTYVSGSESTKVRITVLVTWPDQTGATKTSEVSSVVSLTTECPAGDLHPYAGPCQTEVTAEASAPTLSVEIDPVDSDGDGVVDAGEGFTGLTGSNQVFVYTPDVSTSLDAEQTVGVTASSEAPGFSATGQASCGLALSSVEATNTGTTYASAPSSANDTTCASDASTPPQIKVPSDLAIGSANGLVLQKADGAIPTTGSAVATTAASTTDTVSCNSQTDSRPCGFAQMRAGGTLWALWSATGYSGSSLGTTTACPLVQVTAPSTNSSAYVKRPAVTASTDKATATATRYLPSVTIGCMPTNFTAALWSSRTAWDAQTAVPVASRRSDSGGTLRGFWMRLDGITESVSAESGIGTTASTPSRSGTIYYWNGSAYSSASIPAYNAAATVPSSGSLPTVDTGCRSIGTGKSKVILSPIDPATISNYGESVPTMSPANFTIPAMTSSSSGSSPVTSVTKTFGQPTIPSMRVQIFGANANCNPQLADFAVTIDYGETSVGSAYAVPES